MVSKYPIFGGKKQKAMFKRVLELILLGVSKKKEEKAKSNLAGFQRLFSDLQYFLLSISDCFPLLYQHGSNPKEKYKN